MIFPRLIIPCSIFVLMLLSPVLVRAEFMSVLELSEHFDALQRIAADKVRDGDWQKVSMLQGFVMGVSDSVSGKQFCSPGGTSLGQLLAVIERYISANPDLWDRPAVDVTIKALSSAYPCKK